METISQMVLTFLLNAIWQITLITIAVFFCSWLLRKTSARIQHALWAVALVLSFAVPVFTSLDFSNVTFSRFQTTRSVESQPSLNEGLTVNLSETTQGEADSVISINKNLALSLFAFYLLLLGYRSIKLFKAWKLTQVIRKTAFLSEKAENISAIIEECKKVFGVKEVQILYSPNINSPITMGAFNPVIILPEQLLEENDRNVLLSALGHELGHIKQRDYFLNLLYELIYIPLSFHPAATLVKRRINETRELSCDELVTNKLLDSAVYARSLVQLADSALLWGRNKTVSIGISDADILEKRIMRIMKRPKISVLRRNLMFISASALFVAMLAAAISFTVRPVIAQKTSKQENSSEEKGRTEKNALPHEEQKTISSQTKLEELDELAENKPQPERPPAAKAVGAAGLVVVKITVGKDGKVVSAEAISGHPLLRRASVNAAELTTFKKEAFSKTGTLTFKFSESDNEKN